MLELNKIYTVDVLEGLRMLDDNSIDLIITSPPYNKNGFSGNKKNTRKIWNSTINYAGDESNDFMDEDEYKQWQIDILNECHRVMKENGSMFYNHKLRVKNNTASFPTEWIDKSNMILKDIIVWNRAAGPNVNINGYIGVTEYIFWLIKRTKNINFKRQPDIKYKTNVWKIIPEKNTEHPAPFPIELPDNIIPNVSQGNRITVLDPFMGSGTVALSAIKHGCDYIGFDKFQEYVDMANERINNFII